MIVLDRDPRRARRHLCRMITDDDDPATILMLTAANAPTERVAGLAVDADDYLSNASASVLPSRATRLSVGQTPAIAMDSGRTCGSI